MSIPELINALKLASASKNWPAALSLAVKMPDICGQLQWPNLPVGERYRKWFLDNVQEKYTTHEMGSHRSTVVFVSSEEMYALRNAVLHNGATEFDRRTSGGICGITFLPPMAGLIMHNVRTRDRITLQYDIFINDICDSVSEWYASNNQSELDDKLAAIIALSAKVDKL